MEKKKILHGIIAALIFIALAIGANAASRFGVVIILIAMALHAGEIVNRFGRNWPKNK